MRTVFMFKRIKHTVIYNDLVRMAHPTGALYTLRLCC